jgi:hypothetical protein
MQPRRIGPYKEVTLPIQRTHVHLAQAVMEDSL